jgi:hypothetical protein
MEAKDRPQSKKTLSHPRPSRYQRSVLLADFANSARFFQQGGEEFKPLAAKHLTAAGANYSPASQGSPPNGDLIGPIQPAAIFASR